MPTRGNTTWLLDTSAAVAFVAQSHESHAQIWAHLRERRLGLCGHAAFETYSVLTRLAPPARLTPGDALRLLDHNFPDTRWLSQATAGAVLASLAEAGIGGGSVYDALVAATAAEHGLRLVTRDRRALPVYNLFGVEVDFQP